jgi:hypothetical protein
MEIEVFYCENSYAKGYLFQRVSLWCCDLDETDLRTKIIGEKTRRSRDELWIWTRSKR